MLLYSPGHQFPQTQCRSSVKPRSILEDGQHLSEARDTKAGRYDRCLDDEIAVTGIPLGIARFLNAGLKRVYQSLTTSAHAWLAVDLGYTDRQERDRPSPVDPRGWAVRLPDRILIVFTCFLPQLHRQFLRAIRRKSYSSLSIGRKTTGQLRPYSCIVLQLKPAPRKGWPTKGGTGHVQ